MSTMSTTRDSQWRRRSSRSHTAVTLIGFDVSCPDQRDAIVS
jgi:ribosomal protein L32